jgi:hypothetical protein
MNNIILLIEQNLNENRIILAKEIFNQVKIFFK